LIDTETAHRKPRAQLMRILGLGFGLAVVFGSTVGVGILRLPGTVAAQLGNSWLVLAVWIAGGTYTLLGAVSIAELAAMLPEAGGFYVYSKRAFGSATGFTVGWGDWLNNCAVLAFGSVAAAEYFAVLVSRLAGHETVVALLFLASLTLVHWTGMRLSSVVLQLSASATALTLIVLACACLFHGSAADSALHHALPSAPSNALAIFVALTVAFRAVIVTYDGWYEAIYFAEEDKNPTRTLPRAMIGGVVLIVALYLLINVAFLQVMPLAELAASKLPAADAARTVLAFSSFAALSGKFVTLLSLLTLISLVNSVMLGAPRILFAVGRDGLFTKRVASVSATGTPRAALLLSSLAAAILVASGTFENIVTVAAFFVASIYCLNYVALFTLRLREPTTPRPFHAWGHPFSTGIVLLGSFLFLVAAIHSDPGNALRAFLLLAISVPVYLWMKKRRSVSCST
jgi:APA family basic amino acid/polyamine antiporter